MRFPGISRASLHRVRSALLPSIRRPSAPLLLLLAAFSASSVDPRAMQNCACDAAAGPMPAIFLSHGGGPCFFLDRRQVPMFADMDRNSRAADFLRGLQRHLPRKPSAILLVSAHWEEPEVAVQVQPNGTSLIYDYFGFPPETYSLEYPAPTDLDLASRVQELLRAKGFRTRSKDRGFDHGVFIPLKLAFPDADVPVVQVSLHSSLDPERHIALGEALAPLRNDDVLIIGSGSATHNLHDVRNPGAKSGETTVQFLEWLHQLLEKDDVHTDDVRQQLVNIMSVAPGAARTHPRIEHLVPLHVAYGAAIGGEGAGRVEGKRIFDQIINGNLGLDSYLFQPSS